MDFEFLKGLIDEAATWMKRPEVHLGGFGEPTLYPHLVKAVEYCSEVGMRSSIFTNGISFTPSLVRALVDAGLSWFHVTVNARDEVGYEKLYNVSRFNEVEFNVKEAWKICRDSNTEMRGGSMVCSENEADISNIDKHWRPYFHNYIIWGEQPFVKGRKEFYNTSNCTRPWNQLMVIANGDVLMCCTAMMDIENDYVVGGVKDKSMLEVFNSLEYNEVRDIIRGGKNLPRICKICLSK